MPQPTDNASVHEVDGVKTPRRSGVFQIFSGEDAKTPRRSDFSHMLYEEGADEGANTPRQNGVFHILDEEGADGEVKTPRRAEEAPVSEPICLIM